MVLVTNFKQSELLATPARHIQKVENHKDNVTQTEIVTPFGDTVKLSNKFIRIILCDGDLEDSEKTLLLVTWAFKSWFPGPNFKPWPKFESDLSWINLPDSSDGNAI